MAAKRKGSAMYLAQAVVCGLMAVSYLFSVLIDGPSARKVIVLSVWLVLAAATGWHWRRSSKEPDAGNESSSE